MSAHTPGPWTEGAAGYRIDRAVFSTGDTFALATVHDVGRVGSTPANARLISAAPDLLAALEQIWEICGRAPDGGDIDGETDWEGVRAAIAKARGGK